MEARGAAVMGGGMGCEGGDICCRVRGYERRYLLNAVKEGEEVSATERLHLHLKAYISEGESERKTEMQRNKERD